MNLTHIICFILGVEPIYSLANQRGPKHLISTPFRKFAPSHFRDGCFGNFDLATMPDLIKRTCYTSNGPPHGRWLYAMINSYANTEISDSFVSAADQLATDLNGSINLYPYLIQDEKTGMCTTPAQPTIYRVIITEKEVVLTGNLQRWLFAMQKFIAPVFTPRK